MRDQWPDRRFQRQLHRAARVRQRGVIRRAPQQPQDVEGEQGHAQQLQPAGNPHHRVPAAAPEADGRLPDDAERVAGEQQTKDGGDQRRTRARGAREDGQDPPGHPDDHQRHESHRQRVPRGAAEGVLVQGRHRREQLRQAQLQQQHRGDDQPGVGRADEPSHPHRVRVALAEPGAPDAERRDSGPDAQTGEDHGAR